METLANDSRSISPPLLPRSASPIGRQMSSSSSMIRRKSPRSGQENTPPPHPNVQTAPPPSPSLLKKASDERLARIPTERESSRSNAPPDEHSDPSDSSVKVVVRIRPVNRRDREGARIVQKVSSDTLSVGDRTYKFDSVLGSDSTQEDTFNLVGVPLVKNSLAGYNASVLSYGQTGSGKTYTMWGPPSAMLDCHSINSYQGIVPRIFQMLFSEIEKKQQSSKERQMNYQCRCSFFEVYNDQINDLLDPTQRNLQIRDDSRNGFHVENLTDEYVTTAEDVTQILVKGLSNRKIGATSINSKSSRSHIIFTFTIESWCKASSSKYFSSSKTSKISLVDLAGLDGDKVDGVGRHVIKEGRHVKKSLSKLGKLVNNLAEVAQSGKDEKVSYMDSCLTHLLHDTLGGNAKVTFICAIFPSNSHKSGTLSTLRFGERAKLIRNRAVINEITEDDVNGLSNQIRQLKEELIREKSHGGKAGAFSKGYNARESLNLLRVSLNRSLILPNIDNDSEEELDVDEEDVTKLCSQLSNLHSSSEDNFKDNVENKISVCISSTEESLNADMNNGKGSCLSSSKDQESNVNSFPEESALEEISDPDFPCNEKVIPANSCQVTQDVSNSVGDDKKGSSKRSSSSIIPCLEFPLPEDPTMCLSPKINNLKKSIVSSSEILGGKKSVSEGVSNSEKEFPRTHDPIRCSLQSSKISPTESLAASLNRGLQIIDYHQRNPATKRSLLGLSFEHLASVSCQLADKVDAGAQTSPMAGGRTFLCSACKKAVDFDACGPVHDTMDMHIVPANETVVVKDDNKILANAINRQMELETLCADQEAMIKQLNCQVDQYKHEFGQSSTAEHSGGAKVLYLEGLTDGVKPKKELMIKEFVPSSDECRENEKHLEKENGMTSLKEIQNEADQNALDMSEREAFKEIQNSRKQLDSHTGVSTAGSLLDQIRNGSTSQDRSGIDYEKERQRWTECESRWISLTEELRLELESNRRLAEKKDVELTLEKKCTAELDDALHRSILGHARIIEHYAELQEKYNDLLGRHRNVMEGIAEVKKAAAKAGRKGNGKAFVAALAAELSTLRAEREKERAYLKEQNKGLRIQLRDTAEAVHAAGELLVRLREAEEAVSITEEKYGRAQQENEKLRKQIERMKRKHAMEMVTMKHYLAESRLPESALEPLYRHESDGIEETRVPVPDDDQAWRAAFGPSYG